MTGIEGNFEKPKLKKELPSVEKKDEEEILTDREKEFVKEWGNNYEIYLRIMKRIEEAKQKGIAPSEKDLFIEKMWPKISLAGYGEMYNIIGKTVLEKMELGSKLLSEELKIKKNREEGIEFFDFPNFDKLRKKLNLMGANEHIYTFYQKMVDTQKAIDKVVAELSEKEISKYDEYREEFFKERIKWSKAINFEEKKCSEKIKNEKLAKN